MNCKDKNLTQPEQEFDIRKIDWEALKNVNPLSVDCTTLVDINDVVIDSNLPKLEKMAQFVRQIKNPYCYKCGKMVVKVNYQENEPTLEERLISYFKSLI